MAAGRDGLATDGAATDSSTIIASAKLAREAHPERAHARSAELACRLCARERSHSVTGDVTPARSLTNSRLMQIRPIDRTISPVVADAPAGRRGGGMTTV